MISNRRKNNASEEQTEDANKSQPRLFGFRAVYVFDITQTEGKDLPTLTEVSGDASGYRERLVKFVETQGIVLSYSDRIAPAKGLSHGGRITLLCGMQPAEEFSTLTHEIAHEILHRGDRGYSGEGEHRFRREAERHSGAKVNSSRSVATLVW
jgi:hypothetical protein